MSKIISIAIILIALVTILLFSYIILNKEGIISFGWCVNCNTISFERRYCYGLKVFSKIIYTKKCVSDPI